MNLSGKSVRSFIEYYKIPVEDILVIYDDMDLPLGKLRIRKNGSSGGHRGMKSIIENLGTQEFARIRVGIDKPNENMEVVDYVLRQLSKKELEILNETIMKAPSMIDVTIKDGLNTMMNLFNGK